MAEFFDPNSVYMGFSNVHIVPFADTSSPGKPVWAGDIIPIKGAVNFGPTANNSEVRFFADNILFYSTFNNNGYTGTLEIAKVPADFLISVFRYMIDDNGILVATAGMGYRNFAMMFQVEGNVSPIRLVWYNCSSAPPAPPAQTMEENADPNTQSMDLTVAPIEFDSGIKATYSQCPYNPDSDETMEVYDNWFKQVYEPTVSSSVSGAMYQQSIAGGLK